MISLALLFLLVAEVAPSAGSAITGFSLEVTFNHSTNLRSIQSTDATGSPTAPPPSTIRPGVLLDPVEDAFARIGFGTPEEQLQVLLIDTGSDFTWFQCDHPSKGFRQDFPLFDRKQSHTYRKVRSKDPICNRPRFQRTPLFCRYKKPYDDGSRTSGFLSKDTLIAPSSDGRSTARHDGFIFGCSDHTEGPGFYSGSSGILGLGRGALAIQKQLKQPKFSHCFPIDANARTYLRFGADTTKRGNNNPLRSTPFGSNNPTKDASPTYYYLSIVDFSVNNQRLKLSESLFAVGNQRGCVIDSGTTYTQIYSNAYDQVRSKLVQYFQSLGLRPLVGRDVPAAYDLCYRRVDGQQVRLPSMDIHFEQGDDYHIPPENVFIYTSTHPVFCLAMAKSKGFTVVGHYQQRNMRIIYDLEKAPNGVLLFAPEDCSRDPAA